MKTPEQRAVDVRETWGNTSWSAADVNDPEFGLARRWIAIDPSTRDSVVIVTGDRHVVVRPIGKLRMVLLRCWDAVTLRRVRARRARRRRQKEAFTYLVTMMDKTGPLKVTSGYRSSSPVRIINTGLRSLDAGDAALARSPAETDMPTMTTRRTIEVLQPEFPSESDGKS